MVHYGHSRANQISSKYISKVYPQNLIHIFAALLEKEGKESSREVIERMSKLNKFSTEIVSALKRICDWSKPCLDKLVEILKAFEVYQTLDAKKKGYMKKISLCEKLTISNVLLIKLSKSSESLLDSGNKVLNKSISLEALVEGARKTQEIDAVKDVLTQISGFKTKNELGVEYPSLTTPEVLENFKGAKIKGTEKNLQATLLEDLWTKAKENRDDGIEGKVMFKSLESLEDSFSQLDKYDHVIVEAMDNKDNFFVRFINEILNPGKPTSCLLLFQTEKFQFEILSEMRKFL